LNDFTAPPPVDEKFEEPIAQRKKRKQALHGSTDFRRGKKASANGPQRHQGIG
jgi:hypothetical protein